MATETIAYKHEKVTIDGQSILVTLEIKRDSMGNVIVVTDAIHLRSAYCIAHEYVNLSDRLQSVPEDKRE